MSYLSIVSAAVRRKHAFWLTRSASPWLGLHQACPVRLPSRFAVVHDTAWLSERRSTIHRRPALSGLIEAGSPKAPVAIANMARIKSSRGLRRRWTGLSIG